MKFLFLLVGFIISIFFFSSLFSLSYIMITEKKYFENKMHFSNRFDDDGCDAGRVAQFYKFNMYAKPEMVCKKKK